MQDAKNRTRGSLARTDSGGKDPESGARTFMRWIVPAAALTSVVLSVVLTLEVLPAGPTGFGSRIPVAGAIADRSYKAPFDITVVDREATDEHRRAALEKAPVVYDFDARWGRGLRERLAAAFSAARKATREEPTDPPAEERDPLAILVAAIGEGSELPDSSLEFLATSGFSGLHQGALLRLLEPVASRMIVGDIEELGRNAEKRRVLVLELGSGDERMLEADARVLSVEAARTLVGTTADRALADGAAEDREPLLKMAEALVRPNLSFNLRATDEHRKAAEASVQEVAVTLKKGEIIVRDGEPVSERHVLVLEGIRDQVQTRSQVERLIGVSVLIFMALWAIWRFGRASLRGFPTGPRDAAFLLLTLISVAIGTKLLLFIADAVAGYPEFSALFGDAPVRLHFIIPIAAAAMMVRLVHNAETAVLFSILVALVSGLQLGGEVSFSFFVLVGSLTAAVGAARVTQRGVLLRAGARVGLANMAVIAPLASLDGDLLSLQTLVELAAGFLGGCLSGGVVMALAPPVEALFQYTTDVRLLELANREQPILRELEIRAPGTYHHSMMVGHLAERAAEEIGANSLLARVGGYYHDIGKMRRPHFFVENVTIHRGENRHEKLSPSMSSRIIQAHVKDGLEMGRRLKLAPGIMRAIGEHHGSTIIRYFYEKAKEQKDAEKGEVIEEHEYRYPGPRPQTREAGILMLSDSVEAASRTLADASAGRLQQLVQRIINNYFRDGQLDECSLTLRDLHAIARSFIETLSAIRHERIDYPEATDADGRKIDEDADEGVVERIEPRPKDRPEASEAERDSDIKRLGLS